MVMADALRLVDVSGPGELVTALAAEVASWQLEALQELDRKRMDTAFGVTARAKGAVTAAPPMVQQ